MTGLNAPPPRRDDRTQPGAGRPLADGRRAELEANRFGWALFPVRLFLGVTFVYGGVQKLSDPGFLHPGAPTYIGTQLHGFANGTPGGFLLRAFAIPHPGLAGVGVALLEIAVGLLVTTGLLTRPAAAVGLLLNLLLFFTNSWHTYPYFLGSDIVFVFAWLPFALVGAARQPTLAPMLERIARERAGASGRSAGARDPRPPSRRGPLDGEPELTRRGVIGASLGVVAAATGVIAGLSVLLRGSYRTAPTLGAAAPRSTSRAPQSTSTAAQTSTRSPARTSSSVGRLPSGAVKLGSANQLPAGQAATYRDPSDGQPDIVVREANGRLLAHSAVCTHAGCEVGYQGGQLVCPCHASVFDAQTGAVITGPATTPLPPRKVIEHGGAIYALPT
jgi:thiosulfate dehydrogenase [quinone] large subunit